MDCNAARGWADAELPGRNVLSAGDADDREEPSGAWNHRQWRSHISIGGGPGAGGREQFRGESQAGEFLGTVEPVSGGAEVLAGFIGEEPLEDGAAVFSEFDAGICGRTETGGGYCADTQAGPWA